MQAARLDDLDPVAVGVLDESHILHLALLRALHEDDAVLVEPAHGGIQIGHGEAEMAEALGLRIAVVILEICIFFTAPVVGQLQHGTLVEGPGGALAGVLRRCFPFDRAGQEVERKLHLRKIEPTQHAHAHHAGVEIKRHLGVLDPQHGVIQHKTVRCIGRVFAHARVRLGGEAHRCQFLEIRGCKKFTIASLSARLLAAGVPRHWLLH